MALNYLKLASAGKQDQFLMYKADVLFKPIKCFGWGSNDDHLMGPMLSFLLMFVTDSHQSTRTDFTILPPEMLAEIASHLTCPGLLGSVNKRARAAIPSQLANHRLWFRERLGIINDAFGIHLQRRIPTQLARNPDWFISVELPLDDKESNELQAKLRTIFQPYSACLKVFPQMYYK